MQCSCIEVSTGCGFKSILFRCILEIFREVLSKRFLLSNESGSHSDIYSLVLHYLYGSDIYIYFIDIHLYTHIYTDIWVYTWVK